MKTINNLPKANGRGVCLAVVSSGGPGIKISEKYSAEIQDKVKSYDFAGLFSEYNVKDYPPCDISAILVASGGTEHVLNEIAARSRFLALLYVAKYNSLSATTEFLAYYREQGKEPLLVEEYRNPESLADLMKKLSIVNQAVTRLVNARLGVLGGISSWLIYSRSSDETVKSRIGAQLVNVSLDELVEKYEKAKAAGKESESIIEGATASSVDGVEVSKAYRIYGAIKSLLSEKELDGFTIKCFDLIPRLKTTPCLPLSLFNTDLVPAACEGDVPLLITMALGEWATLTPVFMSNVEQISDGLVTFAHCTSPMVGKYRLLTHFESGIGVGVQVDYGSGDEVTVFRLDSKLTTIRIGVGKLEEHEWSGEMCRTQLQVKMQGAKKLIDQSIGNHYAIIKGNHVKELEIAARMLGLKIERI